MERRCVLNCGQRRRRAVIRYEWACGLSGTEIHNRLVEVNGPSVDIEANGARCRTFSDDRRAEDIPRAGRSAHGHCW
ncbi:hypothetical protein TNCT_277721 [Trichonephila clavata]|uniref:Uncharacterized protein n=1 Tax=Trichonephila clavata TaxID=2740835 RepID=A0A8X6KGC6_TRICU|nr:hypothetical protein TNCT_277721 [Trichonephila clavata]